MQHGKSLNRPPSRDAATARFVAHGDSSTAVDESVIIQQARDVNTPQVFVSML